MKVKNIYDKQIDLPLRKDCRIDFINYSGIPWTCLVDYIRNVTYHSKSGIHSLSDMYSEFKFCALNELPISHPSFYSLFLSNEFKEIQGIVYSQY